MGQTGVPFGQVTKTREFLKICCQVDKPTNEHPKRPIDGFQCKRNEVSGDRFWSFFEDVCGNAGNFFTNCIVYNHCPLVIFDLFNYLNNVCFNINYFEVKRGLECFQIGSFFAVIYGPYWEKYNATR